MGKEIEFAGHIISDTGIRPDEKKFAAIKQFPMPSCIKDVRAFLGLANQLRSFIPDLAHMTSTIRPLLKKGTIWNWLPKHQAAFEKIKDILTSDMVILPFDPNLDTILLTDASRLHGIGFALIQIKKGNMTHSMRFQQPYTYTSKIRSLRTRMHGSTMGRQEIQFLSTRIATL